MLYATVKSSSSCTEKECSYCSFSSLFTSSPPSHVHSYRLVTRDGSHSPSTVIISLERTPSNGAFPYMYSTRGSRTSFESRSSIARRSRREGRGKGREGSRSWVLQKQHQWRKPSDSKHALLVFMCSGMPDLPSIRGEPPDWMHYQSDRMGE